MSATQAKYQQIIPPVLFQSSYTIERPEWPMFRKVGKGGRLPKKVQVQDKTRQDKLRYKYTRQDARLQKPLLEAQDDDFCHKNNLKMIKSGPKWVNIWKYMSHIGTQKL